jgi:hypothetical protein
MNLFNAAKALTTVLKPIQDKGMGEPDRNAKLFRDFLIGMVAQSIKLNRTAGAFG